MQITIIDHNLDLAAGGPPRSKGLHMSDIYGAYYAKMDKRFRDPGDGPPREKMEEGLAFEEILEPVLAARLLGKRPKEQKCYVTIKGKHYVVYYSPDFILFVNGESVLGEFKYTRYSSKGAPRGRKFAKWISQIKLYCYHLNINVAHLYVMFINDDYKPPTAKLRAWELRFSDNELQEEWDIMIRFAKEEGLFGKIKSRK